MCCLYQLSVSNGIWLILVVFYFYNKLRHTHKQEMELPTRVCTSSYLRHLLTDPCWGRKLFSLSEIFFFSVFHYFIYFFYFSILFLFFYSTTLFHFVFVLRRQMQCWTLMSIFRFNFNFIFNLIFIFHLISFDLISFYFTLFYSILAYS